MQQQQNQMKIHRNNRRQAREKESFKERRNGFEHKATRQNDLQSKKTKNALVTAVREKLYTYRAWTREPCIQRDTNTKEP